MDQQVGPLGQLHGGLAKHRVGAIHQAFAGLLRAAEGLAADDPAIVEGHGLACLEGGVDGARRDAQLLGLLHIETARLGLLVDPVGVGRHPVGQGRAAHGQVAVVEQQGATAGGIAHPVAAQGIADPGGGGAHHPFEVIAQGIGAVEVDAGAGPCQPQGGQ